MVFSSSLSRSSSHDAWLAPEAPAISFTQHFHMNTALPSVESPVEDLTEVPDLAGRSRRQNSPGSSLNECMEGLQRPDESPLNGAGVAQPPPMPDSINASWQAPGISDLPPKHKDVVQLARPNPIAEWYASQGKPWDLVQVSPSPRADKKMYGPFML